MMTTHSARRFALFAFLLFVGCGEVKPPGTDVDAASAADAAGIDVDAALDQDAGGPCDGGPELSWFEDTDGDGLGDPGTESFACTMPDGYVDNQDDTEPEW